jgi:hypothetical protein
MSGMSEQFDKDPKKGFIFYISASLLLFWLGFGLYEESKSMWLYGDVATGVIKDSNISCSDPKILVQGEMYRIDNCEDYPENFPLKVISMPNTKINTVYIGVKGENVHEFIFKRCRYLFLGIFLVLVIILSLSEMYRKRWLKKT